VVGHGPFRAGKSVEGPDFPLLRGVLTANFVTKLQHEKSINFRRVETPKKAAIAAGFTLLGLLGMSLVLRDRKASTRTAVG
jgi:hypothetical protein